MTAIEIPTPDPRTFDDASRPFAEALSPNYAVKKMIGRGGMGIVYLARDRRLDRLVAVKTLPPQLAADLSVRERFLRETRAAGGMSHPNIVPIHGADEIDGHVFFVMGYVDGESLAAHVAARGRLDAQAVIAMMRDVASALSHAHRRGIIHRDIKAENILIERSTGRALVTDFGIARVVEAAPLTATGQLLGTVYYVSPEQVAGERVDQRSDLYSLGVVGYLALTGRFPFEGDLASAVLVAHVTRPAPPVRATNRDVPEALAAVIDRCLAKSPAERYASADDLLVALEEATRIAAPQPRMRLISDTEAHAVWQRAAELQSSTVRTSGFSMTDVRAAASEAGISGAYVERALKERGLLAEQRVMPTKPLPRSATRRSIWAGVPLDIVMDAQVESEVDPKQYDRLVNTLREGSGTMGVTTLEASELTWRSGWFGHSVEAKVWNESGHTRIRLTQSMRRAAFAAMSGSLIGSGIAGTAVGLTLKLVLHLPAPAWSTTLGNDGIRGIASAVGALVGVLCVRAGRGLVRRIREYNSARLQTLTELLAARAKDSTRDG